MTGVSVAWTWDAEEKIVQIQLPQQVGERLRGLILAGRLVPGQRLVERDLGDLLGVSRTPIREALAQLRREGLVAGREKGGLFVAGLSEAEIVHVYQAMAALERASLMHLPEVSQEMLAGLEAAGQRLRSVCGDARQAIEADSAWHAALTGHVSNEKLLLMLKPLRVVSTRYELAFFREAENLDRSLHEHKAIEALLREGDFGRAAGAIERHWLESIEPMRKAVRRAGSADQ